MAVNVNGGALEFDAIITGTQFQAQINKIEQSLKGLTGAAQKEASAIESVVKNATAAIAAYASFTTATNFVSDIVKVRGEFQQLEVAFRTMLGSKDRADKLMSQAVELAAKTPFTLQQVGTGAKQLLAYGFAADDITKNLTMLGNVAAGVSAPLGDIVYLYGTLKTQGRAYTRDIMQFTSRGIPIVKALADQFETNEQNIQKLVEAGKIGFPEVEKAFNSLTGSGGLFFNLMQEQSKTLTGLTSNLADAWSRMLNEIGKSNEGLFTDAIKGATTLVDNYKEVLKILEILVIAYGSYRAAIIATNVVTAISTSLAKGYTIAETLRYQAMLISERAMKLLNATMLANPATAVIAGILAFAGALYVLKEDAIKAKSSADLLAGSQKKIGESMAEQEGRIRTYSATLKAGNVSEKERADIYSKLNEISPKLVQNMTAQNISYSKLTENLKGYLTELRTRLTLEANTEALTASIKQENAIRERIEQAQKSVDTFQQILDKTDPKQLSLMGVSSITQAKLNLQAQVSLMDDLNKELSKQQKTTEEITNKGVENAKAAEEKKKSKPKSNSELIDEAQSLEVLGALQSNIQQAYDKATDKLQRERLAKDLKHAADRMKILDVYKGLTQSEKDSAKQAEKTESGQVAMLEKRKSLLEDIEALQRDSKQSGLLKEQTAIDKVNEKYDLAIQKIQEFNTKTTEFNKMNPKDKVAMIGVDDIEALNKIRIKEIQNVSYKADADEYKKWLEVQQQYFADFEDAKKELGINKAKEMYADQTKGFESYISFLESESAKLMPKVFSGTATIGDTEKLIEIGKELSKAQDEQSKRNLEKQKQDYLDLLEATQNFNSQKLAINKHYDDLEATLSKQKNINPSDIAEKQKLLADERKQELNNLEDNYAEQGELYKLLGANLIRYTKEQLSERLSLLKKYLADGFVIENDGKKTILTPAMIDSLKQGIEQADKLKVSFNQTFELLAKIGELGDVFSSLGETLGSGVLQDAGAAISGLASQLGNFKDALNATTKEQRQDVAIQSAVTLIDLVVSSAERRRQAAKEYYQSVIGYQNEYNLSLNDQIRLQNELNKNVFLADYKEKILDGIKASQDAVTNYEKALQLLQEGQAKVGQRNAVDFGAVTKGLGAGAAAGAAIGSVVPVIGTAIGAVVGGIVGGIVGLLGGKKKQDIFVSLMGEYPELIQKSIDGTEVFNETLAKSLVANNLVDDATKGILNNIIDWNKKLEDARDQIRSVVSDLAGGLGDDLRNSLVDAFKNGTDAAIAFGDSVNKTLENIISNMIFNQVFAKSFDELQKRMEGSYDIGGDNNFVDDISAFFKEVPELAKQFDDALAAANKESQKSGLNVFGQINSSGNSQVNNLQGAIKGITEQQADLLAGQFGGLRLTGLDQLKMLTSQLNELQKIQFNTAFLTTFLPSMDARLGRLEMNGIKIKQ